ncbi:DUF1318 domain-containing protein [Propionivibrio sp.]|uniref:DUF1318 domain-containing protein n=1 Tax=Propionivibrio sp. TaxID=2212460 RepID=UPI003BF3341D
MKARLCLLLLALLVPLAACESTPTHLFTYAAQGTVIQAERLVGQFFGKDVYPLPYGGPDIDRPLQRMHARFPQLKAQLDNGTLGLTEDGDVAIREAGASTPELKKLVRAENRDRAVLYTAMSMAVGHGTDDLQSWLPYTDATFGAEWQKQAPSGWWLRNENDEWRRKP